MEKSRTSKPPISEKVAIAGTGRVAQAMGRLLAENGAAVVAVGGRNPERARAAAAFIGRKIAAVPIAALPQHAQRILVAVADDAIEEVARLLAGAGLRQGIVLHTCGAMGAEALRPLAEAGVRCGTIHPLQSLASARQGLGSLPGSVFAIDGDTAALAWARELALKLSGRAVEVPPKRRPLYHAAAVMAGNYVIALIDAAAILMVAAGFDPKAGRRALGPLVETSVANALREGTAEALTGPVQRGDVETVSRHLEALRSAPETVQRLYCAAGLHAVQVALRRGLAPEKAAALEALFRTRGGEDA
ncbi:MAG: DUF2520 domain-containing protein [Bryobacteraceae bacterium]|nr:DUF2520 domain-containing protein [Bryobacteraceae bacterium]